MDRLVFDVRGLSRQDRETLIAAILSEAGSNTDNYSNFSASNADLIYNGCAAPPESGIEDIPLGDAGSCYVFGAGFRNLHRFEAAGYTLVNAAYILRE